MKIKWQPTTSPGCNCPYVPGSCSRKAGRITRIGLNTFCDPRLQGGRLNDAASENLVELVDILGEEFLLYKVPKLDIGLIRGTTADEHGNITMEEEGAPWMLWMWQWQ